MSEPCITNQVQPLTGQAWRLSRVRVIRRPMLLGLGGWEDGSEGVLIWCDARKNGNEGVADKVPVGDVARVEPLKGSLPADAVLIGGVMPHAHGVGAAAFDVSKAKLVYDLDVSDGNGLGRADAMVLNLFDGDADHVGGRKLKGASGTVSGKRLANA